MQKRRASEHSALETFRKRVRNEKVQIQSDDGYYEDIKQGISLGCPMSPLMGWLFLDLLDRRIEQAGLVYIRFMDDWVVLAPTRWKLRQAVKIVNETLAELKVEQHPDKTFIGRTEQGLGFLGYQMNAAGLVGVAPPTMKRFVERVNRLYEQGAPLRCIGEYVRRWCRWALSGLGSCGTVYLCCHLPKGCGFPTAAYPCG